MRNIPALIAVALTSSLPLHADEAAVVASLKNKGAEITETKGLVTGVAFRDCSKFTETDFAQLRQIPQLKQLNLGQGAGDSTLKAIGVLAGLEVLSTNGLDATDEGLRALAGWKKLKSIAMFHPGKRLTGSGFAVFLELPAFESLTVGGSAQFADSGMAAVATLKGLKGFRTWHTGVTLEGVKKLSALPNLASLTLGQRLSNTPPTTLSDECLPVLAGLTSLENLTLTEARLSLGALSLLKKLPKLKRLNLEGIEISEADLGALKQALPSTDVRWSAPKEADKKRIEALFNQR